MNKNEKIIENLKLAMLENGLTQTSLAEKIGLTQSSIQKWLTGKNTPKLSTLEKVAKVTGKPINYFFSDDSTTQNIVGNHNTQHANKSEIELKKEIELLKSRQEVQALTIENLKLRLERLEGKK
ncbi:MAG: helix-turn-helix domain-containing protein [Candidatus Avelusimicrobium sp.]|uniref:helix-turn-helix domain-containing protein n=1 Tax=Candidatus Avelusimicrobium sp. TaxID=3048833 RepID=UPI003F01F829